MKKENVLFLLLAVITVICIMSIGVAVAERSIIIALLSLIGIVIALFLAISLRKKTNEISE